jgi:hypothetical protein
MMLPIVAKANGMRKTVTLLLLYEIHQMSGRISFFWANFSIAHQSDIDLQRAIMRRPGKDIEPGIGLG